MESTHELISRPEIILKEDGKVLKEGRKPLKKTTSEQAKLQRSLASGVRP